MLQYPQALIRRVIGCAVWNVSKQHLDEQEQQIALRELEISGKTGELDQIEDDLSNREYRLERDAKKRVQEILKSKTEIHGLIRAASRDAVRRSRATLLGRLLERRDVGMRQLARHAGEMLLLERKPRDIPQAQSGESRLQVLREHAWVRLLRVAPQQRQVNRVVDVGHKFSEAHRRAGQNQALIHGPEFLFGDL
jgi:hypothetical protein